MTQFDWHTEDDGGWDDQPRQPATLPPPRRKRPLPFLIVILLALVAAGAVVMRQVNQQVESATLTVQQDVLATHNLLRTAVARQDVELFRSILSGREPLWTASQEALLRENLTFDRAFLGWQQTGEATPQLTLEALHTLSETVTLELTPDLNSATLTHPQMYTLELPSGMTETVTLLHTTVYRRGSQRWLFAPADDDFWGNWVTREAETVTLIYPSRDTPVANRLASDLEVLLRRLCRTYVALSCPDDLRVNVRLDTDPASLLAAPQDETILESGLRLNLPAPTLLGTPLDERGYEALYRVYGGWVVTAVLVELTDWQCCNHAPFFQVITDYILNEMDLRPWPITLEDHASVLGESLSFNDLQLYWNRHNLDIRQIEDVRPLYAGADFLLQAYPLIDPVTWLKKLEARGSMWSWLHSVFGQRGYDGSDAAILDDINEEWWQFAYTQTLLAQQEAPLPTPFPDQSLQLLCMPDHDLDDNVVSTIWRYNLTAETWTETLSRTGYSLALPFPEADGWLLQTFPFTGEDQWHTEIWRDDEFVAQPSNADISLSLGQTDPNGRYLVMYYGDQDDESPGTALVDLQACNEEACQLLDIAGDLVWSPDSRHTLVVETNLYRNNGNYVVGEAIMFFDSGWTPMPEPLFLGDAQAQFIAGDAPIGTGYSPFWLDNATYGYLHTADAGKGSEVILGDLTSGETRVALTLDALLPLAPGDISAPVAIRHVLTHPAQPNLLFPIALDALGQNAYLFSYDVASGTPALRLAFKAQPFFMIGFSPNGRWLSLVALDEPHSRFSGETSWLSLHEIATGQTQKYVTQLTQIFLSPRFDWSADSQWVVFSVHDRLFGMVAPDYQYQWVLAHEKGYCATQSWINESR
jgi:hypothetical protein